MTTAVIVILALMVAIQSLIIHRKNKKIDTLIAVSERTMQQLLRSKAEWANEDPMTTMHRVHYKLSNGEYGMDTIRACRSYAASILRIK